jgi:acyl dehydratase
MNPEADAIRDRLIALEDYRKLLNGDVLTSNWLTVDQSMIDTFADATRDHQFIHVDPVRAAAETPFGGTIAHGFLTLSLLSTLAFDIMPGVHGTRMGVNYGFEKVRFMSPVKSGARVRGKFRLVGLVERAVCAVGLGKRNRGGRRDQTRAGGALDHGCDGRSAWRLELRF